MKIKLLLFLFFGSFNSYSQETFISGYVMDEKQKPIAYTNIVASHKKGGTFSDENGIFSLKLIEILDSDVIEFSCLGYKTVQISVKDFKKENSKVTLIATIEKLDEVVIKTKKLKTYVNGKTRTNTNLIRFLSSYRKSVWNEPGHEMGRRFSLGTRKTSYLKNFSFYIKENRFENTILELNIYNIKDNRPFENLNSSSIILNIHDKFIGWKTIDLTDFDIQVKEDVIITVEYIKASPVCYDTPGSCGLYLSYIHPTIATPPMYERDGINDEWQIRRGESLAMTLTYQR